MTEFREENWVQKIFKLTFSQFLLTTGNKARQLKLRTDSYVAAKLFSVQPGFKLNFA
jgi:hypothetical protein